MLFIYFKRSCPITAPVCLLSCVSKNMVGVIFKHVYNYFASNYNLFYRYQAGFLPSHSTVYQLLETQIKGNRSMFIVIIQNRLTRVFHKVFELQTYDVSRDLLRYSCNRSQKVMYKEILREFFETSSIIRIITILFILKCLHYISIEFPEIRLVITQKGV